MDLEDVFCSKVRMKILKFLFRLGQLHTSDLARRIGSNYNAIMKHLTLLEKEELIEHRSSGRKRFFRFTNSLKAQATMKLLEEWENN